MNSNHADLFADLARPFDADQVRVRQQGGRDLHYITARTAMNRLDDVLGPENWWDDYFPGEHSVLCRLTIRLPDGSTLTKCDAGGYAGMADQGDDDKSGYSDSFKRAAVKFGVGRYLYRDGVPEFVRALRPDGSLGRVTPSVASPAPAVNGEIRKDTVAPRENASPADRGPAPRSGKALFAWVKEQEQRHDVGLLRHLNEWAKGQGFRDRMVDWDAGQIAAAFAEANRRLGSGIRDDSNKMESRDAGPDPVSRDLGPLPDCPADGRGLFKFTKDMEQRLGVTLLYPMNDFMKAKGVTARTIDYTSDHVALAWLWLSEKLIKAGFQAPSVDRPAPPSAESAEAATLELARQDYATLHNLKIEECKPHLVAAHAIKFASDLLAREVDHLGQVTDAEHAELQRAFRESIDETSGIPF